MSETKSYFEDNDIVAIKADKAYAEEAVNAFLVKLGNPSAAIPFYAVFPVNDPSKPILMDGFLTKAKVLAALKKAQPPTVAVDADEEVTAMR